MLFESLRFQSTAFRCSLLAASLALVQGVPAAGKAQAADTEESDRAGAGGAVSVGGVVYFVNGHTLPEGAELWRTDGTPAGTVMVKDINPAGGSSPSSLTPLNGALYFFAYDDIGSYLWKSDGTPEGTVKVAGISGGTMIVSNGTLFFRSYNEAAELPSQIWKSDGTPAGTVIVHAFDRNTFPYVEYGADLGGTLLFFVSSALWKTDGTPQGTMIVKGGFGGSSDSSILRVVGGTLYFIAGNELNGMELWKSDGTPDGTMMVKDINPGPADAFVGGSINVEVNGTLFFGAQARVNSRNKGWELWKTDGTSEGTLLVKDIALGLDSSFPRPLVNWEGALYFLVEGGPVSERGLWKSDGTADGTTLVKQMSLESGSVPSYGVFIAGDKFFWATYDGSRSALWTSNGEPAGTITVKDWEGLISSPFIASLEGNLLFFGSTELSDSTEFWKTDGTAEGTLLVRSWPRPPRLTFTYGFEPNPAVASCDGTIAGGPGEVKTFDVFVTLSTENNPGSYGVQGWSLSLTAEGGTIRSISLAGLQVATVFDDDRDPSTPPTVHDLDLLEADHNRAGISEHMLDPTRKGAWSAVVLNLERPETLLPTGTQRIARLQVEAMVPSEVTLKFENFFGFVSNGVTVGGESKSVVLSSCTLRLVEGQPSRQLPSDGNQDGTLDISDGIHLLSFLFLGTVAALPCGDGSIDDPANLALLDANSDGTLDLGDAIRVFGFLFQGAAPPVLGTECVAIPGCPEDADACGE